MNKEAGQQSTDCRPQVLSWTVLQVFVACAKELLYVHHGGRTDARD